MKTSAGLSLGLDHAGYVVPSSLLIHAALPL